MTKTSSPAQPSAGPTPTTATTINEARERIVYYCNRLQEFFLDRDEIIKLMITATAAQEPILFVGRPGTAKSLLASVFCDGMGLTQDDYYEYMLTKFTEPSEVMGPVDITALKQGNFRRKTAGFLPRAKVAFLDEIFKANSAILNMLLTIINERKYYEEGTPVRVPLVMLFAASNEIPEFGEFDALKDRFILKIETLPVKDHRFFELLEFGLRFEMGSFRESRPWRTDCSLDDFQVVHHHLLEHILPQRLADGKNSMFESEELAAAFRSLIGVIEQELHVEVTDRKLIKLFKLMVTQAFIFQGGKLTASELRLLKYCGNNFQDVTRLRERLDELLHQLV